MQLHTIKFKTKRKKSRRVGRGGKRGTTSGRGTKGQRARAGHKIRPEERDIIKRIPKLRGYKFKPFRPKPSIVNLDQLNRAFKSGDTINPESLLKVGLVRKIKGRMPRIKILGRGELKKKLVFKNLEFSDPVQKKIAP